MRYKIIDHYYQWILIQKDGIGVYADRRHTDGEWYFMDAEGTKYKVDGEYAVVISPT